MPWANELKASCKLGMTDADLKRVIEDLDDFYRWMSGQTGAICDGRRWDSDKQEYVETGCGPHGMVVYKHDVARYLDRRPVID